MVWAKEEDLSGTCATGRGDHKCLDVFRDQPTIVRMLVLQIMQGAGPSRLSRIVFNPKELEDSLG